jgi:hypothetical protein
MVINRRQTEQLKAKSVPLPICRLEMPCELPWIQPGSTWLWP